MTDEQLEEIVVAALDRADKILGLVGAALNKSAQSRLDARDLVPTSIPGHKLIDPSKPTVDTFVAFMLDMRDSTKHLLNAVSGTRASQLERLFVETTALFAASRALVAEHGGSTVEYLGDGLLALFQINERGPFDYSPYDAARACLRATNLVVNRELRTRYGLPPIDIGVGLSCTRAIVTTVGDQDLAPKVIGECVYRASRLCKGRNLVVIDKALKLMWPTAPRGLVHMARFDKSGEVEGYAVTQS